MRGASDLKAPRVEQCETMKGWRNKQQEKKPGIMKGVPAHIAVFILGIFSAVIIPLILERYSITESQLVHAGPPPLTIKYTEIKALPNGMMEYHVKHGVRLKNNGWRKGHVDKVELARDGLKDFPEKVTVLHVDKTDLGWLEEKTVEYEFIALLKPFPEKRKNFSFRTTYYGPTGNEIYTEFTQIEGERMSP